MKKGDVVLVRDYSYSRFVVNGKLVNNFDVGFADKYKDQFIVVDTNVITTPVGDQINNNHCNNTIIYLPEKNIVGFIEERFLQLAKHEIVIDGKTIKVSHESFLNLKKQLTQ